MRAKAVAIAGLFLCAGSAWAQPPGKPGLTGALGDELFYNYVEGHAGAAYSDKGGRNLRVFSDTAYGFTGSIFLLDPVYLIASYSSSELSYNETTTSGTARVRSETDDTSVGLGVRIPVAYATDLFGVGRYELVDGVEQRQGGASSSLDAEGGSFELGVRSFISGFAELSFSYRFREVREDQRGVTAGQREILKDRYGVVGVVVPLLGPLNLFGRAEIGKRDSNFAGADEKFERFQLGARFNFRL
jgi:hypothetical protein